MKRLLIIIKFIVNHPIGKRNKWGCIKKFLSWQLSQAIFNYPAVHPFVDNTKLMVAKGMKGATGNIYVGLHECEDMAFLIHYLRPEDNFFDVGANIGSYTILASGVAGCRSVTFEPIPSTFQTLSSNIYLNRLQQKVTALNYGAGAVEGKLFFTADHDTVNHVVLSHNPGDSVVEVPVTTLDAVAAKYFVPICIKIDVEGFETEVINGAKTLLNDPELQVIIIELIGSGATFGYDEKAIQKKLVQHGFKPYVYEPFARELVESNGISQHNNLLYIRDKAAALARVKAAAIHRILNVSI